MTKKDRIAIAISVVYLLVPLALIFGGAKPAAGLLFLAPIVIYWAYRFAKGDISFIAGNGQ